MKDIPITVSAPISAERLAQIRYILALSWDISSSDPLADNAQKSVDKWLVQDDFEIPEWWNERDYDRLVEWVNIQLDINKGE